MKGARACVVSGAGKGRDRDFVGCCTQKLSTKTKKYNNVVGQPFLGLRYSFLACPMGPKNMTSSDAPVHSHLTEALTSQEALVKMLSKS